jgi:phage tail-like protein
MPRTTIGGLKDPQVVHHFALEVQGIEEATFSQVGGIETSHDVIESREVGKDGKQYLNKQAGNIKYSDITLKRGITDSMALYNWRKLVEDGKMAEARKSGSIVAYNAANDMIARFDFIRAWPVKWKAPEFNTTGNSVAIEEITFTHEGITRTQ